MSESCALQVTDITAFGYWGIGGVSLLNFDVRIPAAIQAWETWHARCIW